jgi:Pectic acid lyase
MIRRLLPALVCYVLVTHAAADDGPTRQEAVDALHRAIQFFREEISSRGGYIYLVSADLAKREGEGKVGPDTAWIQPPATPSVGMAYLEAYQLTDDPTLLEAAIETAIALVNGQLESGGWDNMIEFAPSERRRYAYRVDRHDNPGSLRNTTTFDDDKSQSALRFLMALDHQLDFKNESIHEAVQYAQEAFLKAQYPNGAWPQRYREFPDPDEFPVVAASYPETWSRTFPHEDYKGFYTLNDNTIGDLITTLLVAYDTYGDARFLESAKRGGDFFLLARMPVPQPGWAQQYDREMHPAWARKFEPPAISGGESQGVMRTLMLLYNRTGDEEYLEPIPRALEYYRSSLRPDGRLARFYELHTNKPLYFTKEYELTYSDADMPTHYGFVVSSKLDSISDQYDRLRERGPQPTAPRTTVRAPRLTARLSNQAREAIATLDDRGAWVEDGRLRYHGADDDTRQIIDTRTFIDRLETLAQFIAATNGQ